MSILCPHCGKKVLTAKPAHFRATAVSRVLKQARRPTEIVFLATVYASLNTCSMRSARRAIERLCVQGVLVRTATGRYLRADKVGVR